MHAESGLLGGGGLYLEVCNVVRVSAPDASMDDGGVREYAIDPDAAARLWDLSLAATGATPIARMTPPHRSASLTAEPGSPQHSRI
ncbi:hypothetical protein [Streptomyces sp. 3N207]|uniref:hypothetical protein n=1 Tax=Streptomyces sp. 3N207 TaxID=3457417 RepID=UPI003FCF2E7D